MSHTIEISEAVLNGVDYLREEAMFGKGSETFLAVQNLKTAMKLNNERAALYWREVARTCRKLEQRTARTALLITAIAH